MAEVSSVDEERSRRPAGTGSPRGGEPPRLDRPSLSPDGTRLVLKKPVKRASPDAPWRLYALDLPTMRETPLAEHRSVDDQVVRSGPDTVVYAIAGDNGSDLWTVPADGTGSARRVMTAALAPAYVG
jgi:hypothetical protein